MKLFSQTQLPVLILLSVTLKQRVSAEYIGMRISVLPPTRLVFTVIVLPVLQRLLQMFQEEYFYNVLFYSHNNAILPICRKALYYLPLLDPQRISALELTIH